MGTDWRDGEVDLGLDPVLLQDLGDDVARCYLLLLLRGVPWQLQHLQPVQQGGGQGGQAVGRAKEHHPGQVKWYAQKAASTGQRYKHFKPGFQKNPQFRSKIQIPSSNFKFEINL